MNRASRRSAAALTLVLLSVSLACGQLPFQPGHEPPHTSPSSGAPHRCGVTSARARFHLSRPRNLVLDAACNLYIADSLGYRVVRVDPAGAVTVVAGGGTAGIDRAAAATRVRLGAPQALASDQAGNIYVGTDDARVLRLARDGSIRTVAGNGSCGSGGPPSGRALDAAVCVPNGLAVGRAGEIYVADAGNRFLSEISSAGAISVIAGIGERESSGDGGPATLSRIGDPQGLAVDPAGTLYLSDGYSSTVRKVAGGRISRFAGGGTSNSRQAEQALRVDLYPQGLALDRRGNLYVADDLHNQVRRVTPEGVIDTVAGDGTPGWSGDRGAAAAARLRFPQGVALDSEGNLYIADTGNDRVRRVSVDGLIETVV